MRSLQIKTRLLIILCTESGLLALLGVLTAFAVDTLQGRATIWVCACVLTLSGCTAVSGYHTLVAAHTIRPMRPAHMCYRA